MDNGLAPVTGGILATGEVSALQSRAEAVCQHLLGGDQDDRDSSGATVGAALAAFARHGLLDFASLEPVATAINSGDIRRMAAVIEVLARHSGTLASIYMVNIILGGAFITLAATPEQKTTLLPKLRAGGLQLAFAMTEPEAGSDAASLATTATRDGVDFVLDGEKIYTTGAATADWIIVVARVAEATSKRDMSLFLVPKGAAGLTVEPLPKLSASAHASCRVKLSNVRIAASQVLGGLERLGSAWDVLRVTGSLERLIVAAMALGLASAVVERATEFAKSRTQFGQPIAAFQSIQHTLVDMRTTETAMRLFVAQALTALERGGDATVDVCMAKSFCSEQLQTLVAQGMRVMGGRAYFEFEPMARYYREAPFTLYAGGTVEIQKMLIARALKIG